MRFDIVSSLLAWQDKKSSWASAPVVNHGGTYVSLSDGVGENAKSPDGVPNPPLFHPTHSKYQFDPGQFKGIGDYPALCEMLKDACPGCTLYEQRKDTERHRYQLRCNRYPKEHKDSNTFSPQCFTKDNVPPATNKRSTSYSQAAFSRMKNHKMKSKPGVKQACDRREQPTSQTQRNKRIYSNRAKEHETRCHMNIQIFMDKRDGSWHLHQNSDFQHTNHIPDERQASTLNKSDLSPENLQALNILFQNGVNPSIIAQIMTDLVHMNSEEKRGAFLASTIYNIANSEQETMNKIAGIEPNWSSAKKLLATLKS